MNWKNLIKPPQAEGYIKNSSNLVTALFVLAGILYYPTNGYGAVIALIAALIVLIGQKMLIAQTNKDFTEMQLAEKQFQETQNSDYLRFIEARATQMLRDNKVLSEIIFSSFSYLSEKGIIKRKFMIYPLGVVYVSI